MLVGLVSDTHGPRFWKALPPGVARALQGVDLVLHAGDVCVPAVLDDLATIAPVHAVLGNNDGPEVAARGVPDVLETELGGVRVAVLHDSGPATGRGPRMRRRFPDADLLVFGHSHIPWDTEHEGLRLVNPGSPTDRRRQPHGTVALAELAGGRVVAVQLVPVS